MDRELRNLAAPCGLYCGACSVHVARRRGDTWRLGRIAERAAAHRGRLVSLEDMACEGCLSDVRAIYCRECALRRCVLNRGLTHCAYCEDFPCRQLSDFNDDGRPHHGEALNNIRRQREMGVEAWVEEQIEKWRCPRCGVAMEWYAVECPDCCAPFAGAFLKPGLDSSRVRGVSA